MSGCWNLPDVASDAPDASACCSSDEAPREVVPRTGLIGTPGKEVLVASSRKGYPNCDAWFDHGGDVAYQGAIFSLYVVVGDVRRLVATNAPYPVVTAGVSNPLNVVNARSTACNSWDLTVTIPGANPAPSSRSINSALVVWGESGQGALNLVDLAANRPSASVVPRGTLFFASDTGQLSFSDGVNWINVGAGGTAPPLLANWTLVNNAPFVFTDVAGGGITTNQTAVDTGATNRHLVVRPIPAAGAWKRTMRITCGLPGSMGASGGSPVSGLALYDSVSGKIIEFMLNLNGTGAFLSLIKLTNVSTFSATYKNQNCFGGPSFESPIILEVEDDGANFIWRYRALSIATPAATVLFQYDTHPHHEFLTATHCGYICNGGTGADKTGWINPTLLGWDGVGGTL